MGGAFLHKKSLLDQFKDGYKMVNPIKARRTERQWENPIVRHKREKGVQDWAKSFAGKRHYRKLTRFNTMRNEAYTEKTAWAYLEELGKLEGEESRMDAAEKILKAAGYRPGTEGRWYDKDGDEAGIIDVLDNTEWAFAQKVCGQLQEAKQAKKVCPKFVQISTQRDFDKYIKPALGKGADAYGLSDIEGMWWEIADGERAPASAKTAREIRDSISKRPRFIFISGAGAERGIADLSLTEYAEEMGMTVKEYLDGYDAGSWESKQNERSSEDYLQEIYDSLAGAWDKSKFNLSKGYDPDYDCQCVRVSLKENPDFYSLTYVIEPGDANYVADRPASFQTVWRYPNDRGVGVGEELEFQSTDFDEFGKSVFDYFDELKELSTRKTSFESKKSEDSLDDFDNRHRVSPGSKYITFSGLARGDVRDDVRRVLSKSGILDPQLDKPGDSVGFEFGVQNDPRSVRKALAALLELGERNTWYIKYNDGDSEHNRVTMYSPDIPNDMWYAGDVDKIVSYIMPVKSEAVDETLSYEKGNKNSRGEDAPWVIRDHKGGKVLASFAKKADAEAHLERMRHYSKSESAKARLEGIDDWDLCILVAHNPLAKDTYYCYDLDGEWTPHEDNAHIFKSREAAEKAVPKFASKLQRGHLGGFAAWDPKHISIEPVATPRTLKEALHESWAKKLERMGSVPFADLGADPTDTAAAKDHLMDELYSFERSIWDKYDTDADYLKLRLSIYGLGDKSDKPLYTVRYKAGAEKPWQLCKGSRGALIGSFETAEQLLKFFAKKKPEALGRPYRDDVILQILDQDNNAYSKEDLESKTVAELEEIYSELINLADAAKHEAAEVTPRDLQNLARRAFEASGAKGFALDIQRLGTHIIIYTKQVADTADPNFAWHVFLPGMSSSKGSVGEFYVEAFSGVDSKHKGKLEGSYHAQDLKELEGFLEDEFRDLQDTIDGTDESHAAKREAADTITSRDVQAAARSAWSASGAKDFKLSTEKLDDVVRIRAMGPKGEDSIGIWWVVSLPSLSVDQYAEWGAKPYEQEPERTYDAKDLDDLEDFLLDEFKALQETLDVTKEN